MKIYQFMGGSLRSPLKEKFNEAGEALLAAEGVDSERTEISLILADEEEIRDLNARYRGVDRATDVLSFPQFETKDQLPGFGDICLGDVVICTDIAEKQAEEYGHSYEREMTYLFVHSLLHLLGYDHMEEDEKAVMREKEEQIMKTIGLERDVL